MLVKAAIMWTVLLLFKDNLKILYKIRHTDTVCFSSHAKKLMLGSKLEANRLCALYLRRCEEWKQNRRVCCQNLKLCWHLSKTFCLYPVAVMNSICRSIIWAMFISTSVLPEIQLSAKLCSFFKYIFLTDIFCLAVAPGTCTDHAYT